MRLEWSEDGEGRDEAAERVGWDKWQVLVGNGGRGRESSEKTHLDASSGRRKEGIPRRRGDGLVRTPPTLRVSALTTPAWPLTRCVTWS